MMTTKGTRTRATSAGTVAEEIAGAATLDALDDDAFDRIAALEEEVAGLRALIPRRSGAECRCTYFGEGFKSHDRLLGLLDDAELLRHLIDRAMFGTPEDETVDETMFDLGTVEDLGSFVAQHNWRDPVAAYELAANLTYLHKKCCD